MKYLYFTALLCLPGVLSAQSSVCVPRADPPVVHSEGLSERIGDLLFNCTGTPSASVTSNFVIGFNANITNRISAGTTLTGIVFTADSGSGPQPIPVQPVLNTPVSLAYYGVTLTFSAQGTLVLQIAGVRVNAAQIVPNGQIFAYPAFPFGLTTGQLTVGTPQRGLYVGYASSLICSQNGSPLPFTIDFSSLITRGTVFASTRITEGFGDAFAPRSARANLNADAGQRVIIRYSGLPDDARLFVPVVIAGSDTVQPTGGGDFGVQASGGSYAPSINGSLLLAAVSGADANGAGGTPLYIPAAPGSGTVNFNDVGELRIAGGSAYVVYEVVDANPSRQETAQFPTFLGLPASGDRATAQANENVFLAAVSTSKIATLTDPIPRYSALTPLADCTILGDCSLYLPQFQLEATPLQFTHQVGSPIEVGTFTVHNNGGGIMPWVASVLYQSGSRWLNLVPPNGIGTATVMVQTVPGDLAPGTYQATIRVDAGGAGAGTVPVTLVVTPGQPVQPVPVIGSVINSASLLDAPVVPGSLTTIMGSGFIGATVFATFDGIPANILFRNAVQINLVVPVELGSRTSAQLAVVVDGLSSAIRNVEVAPVAPAIFKGAVLNQDSTVNDVNNGAAVGSIIYFYATGLSGAGKITGHIHDRDITEPYYGGPAPLLPGVQQVNLQVPADLPAMTTEMYVCGEPPGGSKVCSMPVPLTLK